MEHIFGIYSRKGNCSLQAGIKQKILSQKLFQNYRISICENPRGFLGYLDSDLSKPPSDQLFSIDDSSKLTIVLDSQLYNKPELAKEYEWEWNQVQNLSDVHFMVKAYERWGTKSPKYLRGDFAAVVFDENKDRLVCYRDHFGSKSFFYYDHEDIFAFSSDIELLSTICSISTIIDDRWIANCLTSVFHSKNQTPFHEIYRIPPASGLVVNSKKTKMFEYWTLTVPKKRETMTEDQAVRILLEKLERAVHRRIESIGLLGCELSGGLDSSGITAIASNYYAKIDKPFETYTHSLPINAKKEGFPFTTENKYCDIVKEYLNIKYPNDICGDETGALEAIKKSLTNLSAYNISGYTMMSDLLYSRAMGNGVKVVLSGFGGDEIVSSPASGFVEELAIKFRWNKLWEILFYQKKFSEWKKIVKFGSTVINAFFSLRGLKNKVHILERGWRRKRYNSFAIDPSFEKRLNTKRVFLSRYYIPENRNVRRRQALKLFNSRITERVENSNIIGRSYGLEYRYPMLDIDLIEFQYQLSSDLKYKNGFGRYIYRKALESLLPSQISWRIDKSGNTIPYVQSRFRQDVKKFRSLIDESANSNNYHYVDYYKMHQMIDKILERDEGMKIDFAPISFFNHIKILLLQKWQRQGEIDIGIKY